MDHGAGIGNVVAAYTPKIGKKGSHWTREQRGILQFLWNDTGTYKAKKNKSELARMFGKCRSNIQRELKRGTYMHTDTELIEKPRYNADLAQIKAEQEKLLHGPDLKIGADLKLCAAILDKVINGKKSPYAIVQDYENENAWPTATRISDKTIYRYIAAEYIDGLSSENLLYRGKRRKAGKAGENTRKHSRAGCLARSISNRPQEINDRKEIGNWEMDTVKGSKAAGLTGHHACLLTLTERKTREEIIIKLTNGKSETVVAAIDAIERALGTERFIEVFKSITPDNGSEFCETSFAWTLQG